MSRKRGITELSGLPSLAKKKRFHTIPDFKLGGSYNIGHPHLFEFGGEGGTTLESVGAEPLRTSYIAEGTPERDSSGRITNAVIVNSYYGGDAALCYSFWYEGQAGNCFSTWPVVGPGRIIDTNRFYVIFLDALGLWGASKPSDGLGLSFPRYNMFDCVQANYRLLRDELNVGSVRLATGVSMGGMQSYVWAMLHPEFVQAIMPIAGSTNTAEDPVLRWIFALMTAAMQSDPVWRETKGNYYHLPKEQHPNQGMMFGWSVLMHNGFDLDFRIDQGWKEVQKEVFFWEPKGDEGLLLKQKARDYDVIDLLYRNGLQTDFDLDPYLPSILCPALILHCQNDLWLRMKLAEQAAYRIPGARFVPYEDRWAHYSVFRAVHRVRETVQAFLDEIK